MESMFAFLHSIYPLSPELQKHLALIVKEQKFKKKDFLLTKGRICKYLYFIEKGLLWCYYEKDGKPITKWVMKEGEVVVSIQSFYLQQTSHENITALENTTVYYISYEELDYIYQNFPEFNFIGRVLTIKYLLFWDNQVIPLRCQTAPERLEWLKENHSDLLLRAPAKCFASYLGLTPETFSKIKGNL